MTDIHIQDQINEINRKMDFLLDEMKIQREKRQEMEDLVKDVSIIGNDLFKSSVIELDKAGVELDSEALKSLGLRFIRNIGTINEMVEMMESANDLIHDVGPIVRQIGLDGIHKMNQLEQKGYFAFAREAGNIADNIVSSFSVEDVKLLADNVVTILQTVKSLTQPDMLESINNAVNMYKNLNPEHVKPMSIWGALRELNTPEMKRGIGFLITFMKNITKEAEISRA